MKVRSLILTSLLVMAMGIRLSKAQTVFVTSTGKKYHSKNCELLKDGKSRSLTLAEAKRLGYDACKACKADEIVATEEKRKKASGK